jgi:hypothetical protein
MNDSITVSILKYKVLKTIISQKGNDPKIKNFQNLKSKPNLILTNFFAVIITVTNKPTKLDKIKVDINKINPCPFNNTKIPRIIAITLSETRYIDWYSNLSNALNKNLKVYDM